MWRRLLTGLVVASCLLAGLVTGPSASARPVREVHPASARAAVTLKPALKAVLVKVNAQRAKRGLRPLRATACLTRKVAQPWAKHLAETETLVHQDLSPIFTTCPGLSRVGENIAYGYPTAGAVVKAWMNSPGHRANILNRRFTKIGLGLARSSDGTKYWVQDFGG